jgi:hypothetical protein
MILKKRLYRPGSKNFLILFLSVGMVFFSILLVLLIPKSWGEAVKFLCGVYTMATILFFVAQLYGFVISQTQYSEAVESPKFVMLENEEAEWKE